MPSRHALPLALLLTLGALNASCGDDGEERTRIPCDIREARCRSAVFALTAQVRAQDKARLPVSRLITRQQFADETRAQVAQSMSTREGQLFEAALRLVRFLPAEGSLADAMADSSIAGVAAYYDERTKAITIVDDSADDAYQGSLTLSHEYVHALQDQREVIANVAAGAQSTDETMAVNALIEGEATILSDVAMTRAAELDYLRDDVLAFMTRLRNGLLLNIEKSPAPFNEGVLVLPYPIGGLPVAEAYLASGIGGVQRFYSSRPSSLIGWVELASAATLPVPMTCDAPDAPYAYELLNIDRLGGTALIALYTRLGLTGSDAFEAARAWTNDTFAVFRPVDSELSAALAWRIRLRDEAAASRLESLVTTANLGLSVARVGLEVVITGATKPEVLSAWTVRNDCSTQKNRELPRRMLPQLPHYLTHALR